MTPLDDLALEKVAAHFRALAEPMRLKILNTLRDGEKTVRQITDLAGTGQANASKHLSVLLDAGLVTREARGTSALYRIADPATFALCDLVCGNVARILERQASVTSSVTQQLSQAGGGTA